MKKVYGYWECCWIVIICIAPIYTELPLLLILLPIHTMIRYCYNTPITQGVDKPVVIDCTKVDSVDFTGAQTVQVMIEDFKKRNQRIVWINMEQRVEHIVTSVCNIKTIKNVQELSTI